MKRLDLQQTLQNTQLHDTWNEPTHEITDPYDRQRLILLLSLDRDVMADLHADAAEIAFKSIGYADKLQNAIVTHLAAELGHFAGWAAGCGGHYIDTLMTLMEEHIDANAEDWLEIARGSQLERMADEQAEQVRA